MNGEKYPKEYINTLHPGIRIFYKCCFDNSTIDIKV